MVKGSGFHLDMLLVGLFPAICGILGLPFLNAAAVQSISHAASLSVFSKTNKPGETPQLVMVKEQRLTGLAEYVLIGKLTCLIR